MKQFKPVIEKLSKHVTKQNIHVIATSAPKRVTMFEEKFGPNTFTNSYVQLKVCTPTFTKPVKPFVVNYMSDKFEG